jgi:hypothetical protein
MRTQLATGLYKVAQSIVSRTRHTVALLDRAIDVNRALDELYWIVAYFKTSEDFESSDALKEIDAWEAKYKNALIYDSTLIDWLQNQLSETPSRPTQARRPDGTAGSWKKSATGGKWSTGNQRRFCLCVARILTLRQMRVDACAEQLRDLTVTQQQILNETLKHFSEVTPEEREHAQKVKEGAIRLTEARGTSRMGLDEAKDKHAAIINQISELNVPGGRALAGLGVKYEQIRQWRAKNVKIREDMLAVVDIADQSYLALVQRGEAIQRILDQSEHLRKSAESFEHGSQALRHQMQGSNILATGGLMFVGGLLLAATGGVAATVPIIGSTVQTALSSISYYVCMLSYGVMTYGAYHYYWSDIQEIKKVLLDRMGKSIEQAAPSGNFITRGASWAGSFIWRGVSTVSSYLSGTGIQISRSAYEYIVAMVESNARARMQQEFENLAGRELQARAGLQKQIQTLEYKCKGQEQLIMKYQMELEKYMRQ